MTFKAAILEVIVNMQNFRLQHNTLLTKGLRLCKYFGIRNIVPYYETCGSNA